MYIKKSKNTISFRQYGCPRLINLDKVCYIELYEKQSIFFYFINKSPVVWKYNNEQIALEALKEIENVIDANVLVSEKQD